MQDDEWRSGYLHRKCQVETCPQEALKAPRLFSIRYPEWIVVYLCPYHSHQLRLTGRVDDGRY